MDIFSLGSVVLYLSTHSSFLFVAVAYRCVIAELFLDGQQLFDLSQLLDYCTKDYNPEQQLKKIPDKNIRVNLSIAQKLPFLSIGVLCSDEMSLAHVTFTMYFLMSFPFIVASMVKEKYFSCPCQICNSLLTVFLSCINSDWSVT